MPSPGTLFVVSAPSGAGKTTLVGALVERCERLRVSVSHTTRPMRPGEQDGQSYHFVTEGAFTEMLSREAFLEHARVFEHWYGTSREWVEEQLAAGFDVILEIDWQGARQIRRMRPGSVFIFVLPPSRETLLQRLTERGQDDEAVIERRMAAAVEEISHCEEADHIVVNDDFDEALDELQCVIDGQYPQEEPEEGRHRALLDELLS